jgi:hypothetical protein
MASPMYDLLHDLRSIEPGALDDAALKDLLRELAQVRAVVDRVEAAAIAEMDHRGCFLTDGAVNTQSWLAHYTGISRTVAGARLRLAKRLARMPIIAAALTRGEVTEQHARSLGRCLTPRTLEAFARDEADLTDRARELGADVFDAVVTRWLAVNDQDGPEPGGRASELHASRTLGDRVRIDGDLDADEGAEFLAELDALYDQLWQEDQAADESDPCKNRTAAERNAAALVEMARRSSATHADDVDGEDAPSGAPRGGRPRRRQLIAVVDVDPEGHDLPLSGTLDDGSVLPRSTIERWLCDCSLGRVLLRGRSLPLDLGQVTYTPSAAQRRALVARDRGCIVDGCNRRPRWCDAHHVVPFPEGPTDLRNLVLLCSRHHKQVHADVIRLLWVDDRWLAHRPDGTRLHRRPPEAAA